MGSYAVAMLFVWTVFEKRLNVVYRRHVEKCAPFAETGLKKIDQRLRIVIRITMVVILSLSLSIIYLMSA